TLRLGFATGSQASFNVSTGLTWTATPSASWITATPKSGTGSTSVTATAAANPGITNRLAYIEVSTTGGAINSDTVWINQVGNTETNTEKLCGKNFIISDFTVIQNGVTIITGLDTNIYPACQQDNIQRFETDGSLAFDEGATKCDPTDPQTEAGNWAFYDSETKLIFDPGPDADTLNIITNNGTVLTLGGSFIEMGDTIEFRQTYTAQ
ncbi:BACON domain-containing protein, partial [Vicingaceae bacterium]|nr:BACON domain-containing protein [Vicingaceae bacterium]